MDEIVGEALRAGGVLLSTGLIVLAYITAKHLTKDSSKGIYTSILLGLVVCAVLGFVNAANVGKPTCIDSETDDGGTSCYEYADDGYEPSFEEQVSVFTFWFIVTVVPITLGVRSGSIARSEHTTKS